ncbi:PAS-domain containing protein [Roseivivax sp. CAU 1761]
MSLDLVVASLVGGAAALSAAGTFLITGARPGRGLVAALVRRGAAREAEEPLFLVRRGRVCDTAPAGQLLLDHLPGSGPEPDWPVVARRLQAVFPDLPEAPPDAALRCAAADGSGALVLTPAGGALRLALAGPAVSRADRLACRLQAAELDRLRETLALAPCPVWLTDAEGALIWANERHRALAEAAGSAQPLRRAPEPGLVEARNRVECRGGNMAPQWFEVVSRRTASGWANYGIEIDAVVRAEITQQSFVQTLAKTFSNLPTGLVIFDRTQRLVLFNPALIDLTGLAPEVLASRPNLMSFFDLLRERQVMPEPRDYRSWRAEMGRMAKAAQDSVYSEIWTLPNGLTYRVTGRPHPDGAIAFLIEDISDEISLTRRFRSELELSQSVIDAFDDAVAVFTASGILAFCNAGYRRLWGNDPDASAADVTVIDATRDWQAQCRPSPVWGELRDFVTPFGERSGWEAEVERLDGAGLTCRVEPIHAGATLVRFTPRPGAAAPEAGPLPAACTCSAAAAKP